MIWNPLEFIPKKALGIDIGTSALRIVELSRLGERRRLVNYGEISAKVIWEKPFRTFEKSTILLSSQEISRAIQAVLEEAKIKTKRVVFSIPDFTTFFTSFELPPMTEEELPRAVQYEARKIVPLPLNEVVLDWQIIKGEVSNQKKSKLKILLVAVLNEVINQYKKIAEIAGLELIALEAEVFGLIRALTDEEKRTILLIDIGAQTTTCSIIEKGVLKISYSFDLSGNELNERISKGLGLDYQTSQVLKEKYGILELPLGSETKISIREILLPLIDLIIKEIEKISQNYYLTEGKEIQKIILAGASALMPGLPEYFQDHFKKELEVGNPFSNIFCPPILEETLKKMGPSYAIAVGLALRGLE